MRTGPGRSYGPGMDQTPTAFLSPRQAATRAGCGRSSIMRALSSGDLPARRDNKNRWIIDPADLDKWSGHRPDIDRPVSEDRTGPPAGPPADTPETLVRLAVAEARLSDALARIEELQRDRDAWQAQAQNLTGRGWFSRLFGVTRHNSNDD